MDTWCGSIGCLAFFFKCDVPNNPSMPTSFEVLLDEEHGVDPLTII